MVVRRFDLRCFALHCVDSPVIAFHCIPFLLVALHFFAMRVALHCLHRVVLLRFVLNFIARIRLALLPIDLHC